MLRERLLVVIVLIPVGVAFIAAGGWWYTLLIAAIMGTAAWEYWRIFHQGGFFPSRIILIISTTLLVFTRHAFGFQHADVLLTAAVIASMGAYLFRYEAGETKSGVDLVITLGGILYIGWLGSYFISLRNLPDGLWWVMLVIPLIGIGDAGAYFIGSRFGKHALVPRVSPKKTWEGYIGGGICGVLGGMLLASLWHLQAPAITWDKGLVLGVILSLICPLGDLGESMLKRQFNVKDASAILPGHGGMLDRIDSWLWAAPLGYYLILWLW